MQVYDNQRADGEQQQQVAAAATAAGGSGGRNLVTVQSGRLESLDSYLAEVGAAWWVLPLGAALWVLAGASTSKREPA